MGRHLKPLSLDEVHNRIVRALSRKEALESDKTAI